MKPGYFERIITSAEREIAHAEHHLALIAMKDQLRLFEVEPVARVIPFPLMRHMEIAA